MSGDSFPVQPLLEVRKLSKRFQGLVALDGIDLSVTGGSIHSIIGPNGAGKTTLFNCITQFTKPTRGEIRLAGERIDGLPSHLVSRAGLARTYQNIRLFRRMSCIENVLVAMHTSLTTGWWEAILRTRRWRREEDGAWESARELLRKVGLSERAEDLAGSLPYGQQRRLEIARALASRPLLLMLDEPLAGMNPREVTDMIGFLVRIRQDFRLTVLLIEHQVRAVMTISDCVTVLDHGLKIAEAPPAVVQKDERVLQAYLGSRSARAQLQPAMP
jgi:branched-chain amino acid transport system ATP-binding protein